MNTTSHPDRALTPELEAALANALAEPAVRVRRITAGGQSVWLKRDEKLGPIWRLRKGDAKTAFEADREALHLLGAKGMAVPPILTEGADHFVTPHMGRSLSVILRRQLREPAKRLEIFTAAGAALAKLHDAGYRHGRPSIRDMLWNGRAVTLIDFERFRTERCGPRDLAEDAMVFVHSLLAYGRGESPEMRAAIVAYRAAAPAKVWDTAKARARRLAVHAALLRPLARLSPRSRDLGALPMTVDYLRRA
ncbi:MAG: hypothetical protein R3E44_03990 [Paracoccaceae bacterium]